MWTSLTYDNIHHPEKYLHHSSQGRALVQGPPALSLVVDEGEDEGDVVVADDQFPFPPPVHVAVQDEEEEFEGLRKTHQRAVESMQSSLENESKAKNESFRHKKKLEADLNELDIALQHANGANAEAQQTIKKYQGQIREAQQMLETEQQYRDKAREQLIQSERKAHAVRNELEETKTQLEHADRQRRTAEQELSDVMEQVADSTLQNQALESSKRKLDSEMQTMQVEIF